MKSWESLSDGGEALYGVIALKKTPKKTEKPYSRMIKVEK